MADMTDLFGRKLDSSGATVDDFKAAVGQMMKAATKIVVDKAEPPRHDIERNKKLERCATQLERLSKDFNTQFKDAASYIQAAKTYYAKQGTTGRGGRGGVVAGGGKATATASKDVSAQLGKISTGINRLVKLTSLIGPMQLFLKNMKDIGKFIQEGLTKGSLQVADQEGHKNQKNANKALEDATDTMQGGGGGGGEAVGGEAVVAVAVVHTKTRVRGTLTPGCVPRFPTWTRCTGC
jgi:hypothetical protein